MFPPEPLPAPIDPRRRMLVVLVSPLHPGNVGAAARAVKNMGLGGLAVIEPVPHRDPAPFLAEARRLAVEATDILDAIRVAATLDDLTGPGTYVVATTAKPRRGIRLQAPRQAAPRLLAIARNQPIAILFGREDHGLPDRLIARASLRLQIPAASAYPVLNLAQSVMVVAYELHLAGLAPAPAEEPPGPAAAVELDALHREAADALAAIDFLKAHNQTRILSELKAVLARACPNAREVRMLRGVCRQVLWLVRRRAPPSG